uniref:Uncharacterized protein n=1 Tax=Cacopsylla melanoneura TaxID=428564 RepID=A0A8D8X1K2_9HEMI
MPTVDPLVTIQDMESVSAKLDSQGMVIVCVILLPLLQTLKPSPVLNGTNPLNAPRRMEPKRFTLSLSPPSVDATLTVLRILILAHSSVCVMMGSIGMVTLVALKHRKKVNVNRLVIRTPNVSRMISPSKQSASVTSDTRVMV